LNKKTATPAASRTPSAASTHGHRSPSGVVAVRGTAAADHWGWKKRNADIPASGRQPPIAARKGNEIPVKKTMPFHRADMEPLSTHWNELKLRFIQPIGFDLYDGDTQERLAKRNGHARGCC
jgi:hypothetical protein